MDTSMIEQVVGELLSRLYPRYQWFANRRVDGMWLLRAQRTEGQQDYHVSTEVPESKMIALGAPPSSVLRSYAGQMVIALEGHIRDMTAERTDPALSLHAD